MSVKEKLVELMKTNACQTPFMCDPACKYYSFGDCFPYRFADHLIAHGVTVLEWISVKDRLPRKEEYIATTDDGTEYYVRLLIAYKTDTVEYEIGYYDGYKWMTEMPIRTIKNVMAWMLFPNMPQSPKGE